MYTVSRAVLAVVEVAGLISVAVLAPNAVQMFGLFHAHGKKKHKNSNATRLIYDVNSTINRLHKEKCVVLKEREDGVYVSLTKKGEARLARYETEKQNSNPQQWDGKWRVVVFDIPEGRKSARNRLRAQLRNFGFQYLQNSVWVSPYDCEDFISMLKTDQKLWGNVLYLVAERVEGEERLRKKFHLPER